MVLVARGVRRARQPAAVGALLAPDRRLGDRARRARDAGHRDRVRPSSAGAAATAIEDRRADRRRRRSPSPAGVAGFDADHAVQTVDHRRHRRADRRLHDPGRATTSTGAPCRRCPAGSTQQFIGALVFVMTGFGLGWVNAAADYSRYLPRNASSRGVVGWTTFGGALGPVDPASSSVCCWPALDRSSSTPSRADPIGALTTLLPTWFLVPFAIVAVLGLVGGAVLDIYSSGLALLTPRAADPALRWPPAVDGVIMIAGTIYVVFFADNFLGPVPGLPDHARRADRRLVRRHAGRPRAAPRATTPRPSCSTRAAATATSAGCRSRWSWAARRSAGAWSPTAPPAGSTGRATCSARSAWAARTARGRSPASASSSRC